MNRAILAVLALSVLLIAGCTGGEQAPDLSTPFAGGTTGLALSFPEGMPPVEVYDAGQMPFSVGIQIENAGGSSIGIQGDNRYGYVELIGINPSQFGKQPGDLRVTFSEAQLELQGARKGHDGTILSGELSLIQFNDLSFIPDRFGNSEVTIRANVCYDYITYTNAEVCFKDNVLENIQDDTICTLTGAKPFAGSGGPVQVTQVTQNPAGSDKIQVTFSIENLGTGMLFAPSFYQNINDYQDACLFNAGANPMRDRVYVRVGLDSDDDTQNALYEINCPLFSGSSQGAIALYGGAPATLTCTINTQGRDGSRIFTDDFSIDLNYAYLDWIETPLIIRDQNVGMLTPDGRRFN